MPGQYRDEDPQVKQGDGPLLTLYFPGEQGSQLDKVYRQKQEEIAGMLCSLN